MILESLGVEKYIEEHMNSTDYVLRLMKYKSPQTNDTKLGLVSHTDQNITTILYQNQVGGLEVMTKDEKWISYMPSPNSFVVMIGDSLKVSSFLTINSSLKNITTKLDVTLNAMDVASNIVSSNCGRDYITFY
jgi:isopenicillin N synthase-like dioxygenase